MESSSKTKLATKPTRLSESVEQWMRALLRLEPVNWEERNFYKLCVKTLKPLRGQASRRQACAAAYKGWVNLDRPHLAVSRESFLSWQRAGSKVEDRIDNKPKLVDYSGRNMEVVKRSALRTICKGVCMAYSGDPKKLNQDIESFFDKFLSPQFDKGNMVTADQLARFLQGKGYFASQSRPVFVAVGRDNLTTDLLIGATPNEIFIGRTLTNYKPFHELESKGEIFNKFGTDQSQGKKPFNRDSDFDSFGFLNLGK